MKPAPLKFWDLYLDGRWIGMVLGKDVPSALDYAKHHFPHIELKRMSVLYYGPV
jgi:hypothetical protein